MLRRSPVALKNHDRKKRGKKPAARPLTGDWSKPRIREGADYIRHPPRHDPPLGSSLWSLAMLAVHKTGPAKHRPWRFDVELLFYPRGSFIQFISSPSAFHQSGLYSPCLHDAFDVLLVTAAMTGVWPILADRCVSPKISIRPKSHLICQYNSQVSEPYMSVGSSVRLVSGAYLSASWLRSPAYVFP